jgi:hypothetical protein
MGVPPDNRKVEMESTGCPNTGALTNRKGSAEAEPFVFALYIQDTKPEDETCQISLSYSSCKWRGMLVHYFGFFHKGLTVFGGSGESGDFRVSFRVRPVCGKALSQNGPQASTFDQRTG